MNVCTHTVVGNVTWTDVGHDINNIQTRNNVSQAKMIPGRNTSGVCLRLDQMEFKINIGVVLHFHKTAIGQHSKSGVMREGFEISEITDSDMLTFAYTF